LANHTGNDSRPTADRKKMAEICEALFIEEVEYRSQEDLMLLDT